MDKITNKNEFPKNKCEICGKSFSQAGVLKRHIDTVHERHKFYKCEICGKSFSQSGVLKKHINKIHKYNDEFKWAEMNSNSYQTQHSSVQK